MDTFGRNRHRACRRRFVVVIGLLVVAQAVGGAGTPAGAQEPAVPTIPRVSVRYAHAAFLDQT